MPRGGNGARCPENEFIELLTSLGPQGTADKLDLNIRNVYSRRANLEKKLGRQITGPEHHSNTRHDIEHPGRIHLEVENGIVLVFSDAHFWPGEPSAAHKAFVLFCKQMKPSVVICNGDAFDGATISRHPPIGWEKRPSVIEELEICKERLGEIEAATFKAKKIWNLGNHCARFETRLATVAPEYAKVNGFHLHDHFPLWENAWSCFINDDVVVKHRFKGGIHARHNNTVNAGKTIVTGHLHNLGVTPFNDYDGCRWGVDTGTLAEPYGLQFEYLEDNPRSWRSGFAVLTFRKSRLLWPEVVHVIGNGQVEFRGELISV